MSLNAIYHAREYLKSNPSREEVEKAIAGFQEAQEWAIRNEGPGMDGCARSVNYYATKMAEYRYWLKHGKVYGSPWTSPSPQEYT